MKLLLDENLPHGLRHEIPGHDCETASYRGWAGKKNGELLRLAANAGFDALITKDTKLQHQQNVVNLPTAVIVLRGPSNHLRDIRLLIPALLLELENLTPKAVTVVNQPF